MPVSGITAQQRLISAEVNACLFVQLVLQLKRLGEALRQAPTAGGAPANPGLRDPRGSVGCSASDTGNPPSPLPGAPNPGTLPPTPGLGAGRPRRMALQAALTPGSHLKTCCNLTAFLRLSCGDCCSKLLMSSSG